MPLRFCIGSKLRSKLVTLRYNYDGDRMIVFLGGPLPTIVRFQLPVFILLSNSLKTVENIFIIFHILIHIDGIHQPSLLKISVSDFFHPIFAAFAKILIVSKI